MNMNTSNIDALALAAETRPRIQLDGVGVKPILAEGENGSEVASLRAVAAVDRAAESTVLPQAASYYAPPAKGNRKPGFADKLYEILSDKKLSPIISWLPSGKSFCIMNKTQFTKVVLPMYFKESKFESFSRRLKRWGFKKAYSSGQEMVVITHDLFQKGRPDLCKMMNCRANQSSQAVAEGTASTSVTVEKKKLANELALAEKSLLEHQAKLIQPAIRPEPKSSQVPQRTPQPSFAMTSYAPKPAHHHQVMIPVHEIPMRDYAFEANSSMNPWYSSYARPPTMPHVMPANADVSRQLSSIDDEIADCEEQLAILHRLRALREKRRVLG
jgi:hypothetical protein